MGEKMFLGLVTVCLFQYILILDVEAAVSEQMLNQMKAMHQKTCMGRSGVKKEMLAKFKADGEMDDPSFKSYLLCMCKNLQVFKNGKMQYKDIETQAKTMLPPVLRDAILEVLSKCSQIGGDTPEDLVYNYAKCCRETNIKSLLIV